MRQSTLTLYPSTIRIVSSATEVMQMKMIAPCQLPQLFNLKLCVDNRTILRAQIDAGIGRARKEINVAKTNIICYEDPFITQILSKLSGFSLRERLRVAIVGNNALRGMESTWRTMAIRKSQSGIESIYVARMRKSSALLNELQITIWCFPQHACKFRAMHTCLSNTPIPKFSINLYPYG